MAVQAETSQDILRRLRAQRGLQKAALTRCSKFLKGYKLNTNDEGDFYELKTRLKTLDEAFAKFDETQSNIELMAEDEEESSVDEQHREEFEAAYYKLHARLEVLLSKFPQAKVSTQKLERSVTEAPVGAPKAVQLPTLNLPRFEGDYHAWLEFRDGFLALVDKNADLSNIEKLHHLRSCLHGDALETIRAIPISSDNYGIAWQQLVGRYERNHLITNNHVLTILNFAPVIKESGKELRQLYNTTRNSLEVLRNLGAPVDEWDMVLIPIIAAKLDKTTRKEWERISINGNTFKVRDLLQLLQQRCEFLERMDSDGIFGTKGYTADATSAKAAQRSGTSKQQARRSFIAANHRGACPHCSEQHPIFRCQKFMELPMQTRQDVVRQHKLCFNCLKSRHTSKSCIAGGCKRCGMKHNTLLHPDTARTSTGDAPETSASVSSTLTAHPAEVLLSTAVIYITDRGGKDREVRALLDSGSQSSFITRDILNKLSVASRQIRVPVKGISQGILNVTDAAKLTCRSRTSNYTFSLDCLVLDRISDCLPPRSFSMASMEIPDNINLADPMFTTSRNIDMLIGAPTFWELLCVGQIRLAGGAILQKTLLGWVVSGSRIEDSKRNSRQPVRTHLSVKDQIEKFWRIEEITTPTSTSDEEAEFERVFKQGLRRREDGRFEVALPLKADWQGLGESFHNARRRFLKLERTINERPQLKEKYTEFMREYCLLGHMTEVLNDADQPGVYYLPHHAVIKQDSTTTKLRVVFDGSARTTNGTSLNDALMRGKLQQDELVNILLRFRKHKVVIASDIEKMYRQVYIRPEHRDFQRILWRESPEQPIRRFRLNTVTYGTKAGSFLAIRCLHEVAERIAVEQPLVSTVIKRDFYVDDLLTGGESATEVLKLREALTATLAEYGFHLRKWNSNDRSVVRELKKEGTSVKHLVIEDQVTKTLGLLWDASQDTLKYSSHKELKPKNTKRGILSAIAQIFDPLGLIGPVTVLAKLLMQEVWRRNIDWDDTLPQDLHTKWQEFRLCWEDVQLIEVPRRVMTSNTKSIRIHGFCDASQAAYGACIYMQSQNEDGQSMVRLLCSKSRVAPLKTISLPRLELCGAVLLAKLVGVILNALQISPQKTHLWTDSQIVLAWLSKEPSHWQPFVANRVAEIQQCTDGMKWRHVPSLDNPADIISRGMHASRLAETSLWWHGPSWLGKAPEAWPRTGKHDPDATVPERRKAAPIVHLSVTSQSDIWDRYSSFKKLQRVIGYIRRFRSNCRSGRQHRQSGLLREEELEEAFKTIVRAIQAEQYSMELEAIKTGKPVPASSKILSLNPLLDNDGILRVGGRISSSQLPYQQRHQIILPGSHKITSMVIRNEHLKELHAGPQALLYTLRQRFWIPSGRSAVRKVLNACTTCFRANPKSYTQMMGSLPGVRTKPAYPFENVGLDYAGPFDIKVSRLRNARKTKAYICLFICMASKAVHLELVTDLSTQGFLDCFKRFISRRGKPSNVYSDNATNFVGASHELKRLEQSEDLVAFAHENGTKWHFIPPRAPHFGGLWEAAIKSAKYHLKRVVGQTILTYEEFYTVLTQIEACLNSRPLTPMSNDPNDLIPLTPAHFLLGRPTNQIPEPHLVGTSASKLPRHQCISAMGQHFWQRWSKEYLNNLQQRSKWKQQPRSSPQVGEIVVIKEDNTPPLHWRLGRITKVHPGADGVVRVVELRTSKGVISRPVIKLCPLPIDI